MLPPSTMPMASSSMLTVPSGECFSERLTEKQNLGSSQHQCALPSCLHRPRQTQAVFRPYPLFILLSCCLGWYCSRNNFLPQVAATCNGSMPRCSGACSASQASGNETACRQQNQLHQSLYQSLPQAAVGAYLTRDTQRATLCSRRGGKPST